MGAGPGAPLTLSAGALAAVVVTCVLLGLVLAVGVALLVQRRCAQSTNKKKKNVTSTLQLSDVPQLHVAIIISALRCVSGVQQQRPLPLSSPGSSSASADDVDVPSDVSAGRRQRLTYKQDQCGSIYS